MDIKVGDKVKMKKQHPCGNDEFEVLRVGMDVKLKCIKCGHVVEGLRSKLERSIKSIGNGTK